MEDEINNETKEDVSYADAQPLMGLVGNHPKTRMISVMLGKHYMSLNITEISRLAGISRSTVYDHIDDLIRLGVIKKSGEMGNSTMYTINKDSEIAKALGRINHELIFLPPEDRKNHE